MNNSPADTALANDLETALNGLAKLTKALSFYPREHPALDTAAEEARDAFQPLLARHEVRPYHVTQKGFSLDAIPLAPTNENLRVLAKKMVERRVRHLLFLQGLTKLELLSFAEEFSRPAAEIIADGGLPQQLAERKIKSIWINETDPSRVMNNLDSKVDEFENIGKQNPLTNAERKTRQNFIPETDTATATPPAPPPQDSANSVVAQVRDLLESLKEPLADDKYSQVLDRIGELAPEFFSATGTAGILTMFNLLGAHRHDGKRSTPQREMANKLTDQLLTEQIQRQLVDLVAKREQKQSQQRVLAKVLIGLNMKIAPLLLERLFAERNAITRRLYTAILAKMGTVLFGLLENSLAHGEWHVVRNVITVLGETHHQEAIPLLLTTLHHPEVRVRRALIPALAAIGGNRVIQPLTDLAQDEYSELHQPAIMALGALEDPDAIPALIRILEKLDLAGKRMPLKIEVIRALAAIKSPQAIPHLLQVARRPNLLKRKNLETLQAEAILALGQLGDAQLIPTLDQLQKSAGGPVSKALQQATAQLKKQKHVT